MFFSSGYVSSRCDPLIRLLINVYSKASGNLGAFVLKLFLDSRYNVTILTRNESQSTFPEGVPVIRADYSNVDELKSAMEGQDEVSVAATQGSAKQR